MEGLNGDIEGRGGVREGMQERHLTLKGHLRNHVETYYLEAS